ncbi:MAG: hypothetical protein EAX87_10175 [Candidatus Thorarchaeota archaeon]|nr:hypothetical protein [Candidatus Thorarchaeota archaeon]
MITSFIVMIAVECDSQLDSPLKYAELQLTGNIHGFRIKRKRGRDTHTTVAIGMALSLEMDNLFLPLERGSVDVSPNLCLQSLKLFQVRFRLEFSP